jgi:hypothetical protein
MTGNQRGSGGDRDHTDHALSDSSLTMHELSLKISCYWRATRHKLARVTRRVTSSPHSST